MRKKQDYIRYSQCWEDTDLLLEALDITTEDSVISVTSGGCNTFALMAKNPAKVYTIDSNKTQTYLFELKFAAIQTLSQKEVLEFLGYAPSNQRLELYERVKSKLSKATQEYWDNNTSYIEQAVIDIGKFEKYLKIFRTRILPWVHTKSRIKGIFDNQTKQQQALYYNKTWNSTRWRFMFACFFSARIMKALGRHKEMFVYNPHYKPAELYFKRTEHALRLGQIQSNYYLEYILLGKFNSLPHFLKEERLRKISTYKNIEVKTQDIFSFLKQLPDNSISKFNVSDVFEPLSQELTQELFAEIYRVAKNGARILFWNNLVERKPQGDLSNKFVYEDEIANRLKNTNKVFFYDNFYIMSIQK